MITKLHLHGGGGQKIRNLIERGGRTSENKYDIERIKVFFLPGEKTKKECD